MRPSLLIFPGLLLCCASSVDAHVDHTRVGAWSFEVVDEDGHVLETFRHKERVFALGVKGRRYTLRIHNRSSQRVEAVASVDGRDVLDGQPSSFEKRGYLIAPYSHVVIDGFRLSDESVAAFRFSSVPKSYAAQMGDARDVGVIGVSIFEEKWYAPPPRPPISVIPRHQRSGVGSGPEATSAAPLAPSSESLAEGAAGDGESSLAGRSASKKGKLEDRPGLGTEFGEERYSVVERTEFVRASSRPRAVLSLRYNDRSGLIELGIDVDRRLSQVNDAWLRNTAVPFRRDPPYSNPPPGWHP